MVKARPNNSPNESDVGAGPSDSPTVSALEQRRDVRLVARAQDDLRRSSPVRLCQGTTRLLMLPAAAASPDAVAALSARLGPPFVVLTRERAAVLKIQHKGQPQVRLAPRPDLSAPVIAALADASMDLETPLKGPFRLAQTDDNDAACDAAALTLLKRARLLPAALIWSDPEAPDDGGDDLFTVPAATVHAVSGAAPPALKRIATARVPLDGAENCHLVGYRPEDGGLEHFALVIGSPANAEAPLVRLHSECFTGDLLGSLKCDCGDQLRGAIKRIAADGHGVLLYLAQEGRGIGLMSKLKAYALQDQGFDTVEANLRLGFGVDERLFHPAAAILHDLGLSRVRLLTNNPEKVRGLEAAGVTVADRVAHAFEANPHNDLYLQVKRDKTGHYL